MLESFGYSLGNRKYTEIPVLRLVVKAGCSDPGIKR